MAGATSRDPRRDCRGMVLAPIPANSKTPMTPMSQSGQTGLSISEPDDWVVANFKETQLGRIRPGQPVEISVDALPDHKFTGKVDSFQSGTGAVFALLPPDNATGNFTKIVQRVPVKILFDRASIRGYEQLIVPGLSVDPKIRVKPKA
jgi:membrane fusion protein, multidrug efflux system